MPGTDDPRYRRYEVGMQSTEPLPPVEVAGIVGGVARRVPGPDGHPADSMLAVYKDRFTYTFIIDAEVASIHFDQRRREIFFRGHNIQFMSITPAQARALHDLCEVLVADREARRLLPAYRETLALCMADTKK